MKIGRNAPCPCGSGRKYKHCCEAKDRAAEREEAASAGGGLGDAAFSPAMREAARAAPVWEADAVPLQAGFESEPTARLVGLLVLAGGLVVHHDMNTRLGGEPDDVAEALERVLAGAARRVGQWPAEVRVRHGDVAVSLGTRLADRQIQVNVAEDLPDLREAALSLMEHIAGAAAWPPVCMPDSWAGWRLPRSLLVELLAAAEQFWRAAPWHGADNLQAPRVQAPSGREWTAAVLGAAEEQYGLALYSDEKDLFHDVAAMDPEQPFAHVRGRVLSLAFEPPREAPPGLGREVRALGWSAPGVVPWLLTINTPGGGISRLDAQDLTALLRSVPAFVAAHARELERERQTARAARIEWHHAATATSFRYDGQAVMELGPESRAGLGPDSPRAVFEEVLAEVEAELGAGADDDQVLTALNQRLARRTGAYNQRPQSDLGGLSPVQVGRLLYTEWDAGDGAIALNRALPPGDVSDASLVAPVRALLELAAREGSLPLTEAGNLRLAVVRELLERLAGRGAFAMHLKFEGTRLREEDVWPLHVARVTAGVAGLLHKRKGALKTTRLGVSLLRDHRAGELFARLFRVRFTELNLAFADRLGEEWPELQSQAAFTIFRFGETADTWRSADWLLEHAVLPYALDVAPRSDTPGGRPASLLARRILDSLVGFGMAEADGTRRPDARYRKTALFDRFLRFDI